MKSNIKKVSLIISIFAIFPNYANALNTEGDVAKSSRSGDVRSFEKKWEAQRDLLGRKVIVAPGSQGINSNSLQLDVAPGSTVILNLRQLDRGRQITKTPYYKNVEIPK